MFLPDILFSVVFYLLSDGYIIAGWLFALQIGFVSGTQILGINIVGDRGLFFLLHP
jgi:hypothetical protein